MSEKANNVSVTSDEITEMRSAGKVTFANEVIAIIAALAASDTKGIAGMVGSAMSGITEMLGRKNLTKGVKVEVGSEEAAVDVYVVVYYGYKIQDVASSIQESVKSAVETMTGLHVIEVNVYVQGIEMEKDNTPVIAEEAIAENVQPQQSPTAQPRVK